MSHTETSWKSRRGETIYAQEWTPDQPARGVVVLVHGLGEHTGRYARVAQALNAAGYVLTGADLPGHGKTTGARGYTSFEEASGVIDQVIESARRRYNALPSFLYGHSMGGALVIDYVLRRKPALRGVVVTSPGLAAGEPVPGWKVAVARVMARLYPAFGMANGLDRNNLSRDPAVLEAYERDPLVHDRISALLGLDLLTRGKWVQEHAGEWSLPLLLMQGSGDHVVSPQAVAAFAKVIPAGKITYKTWDSFYHETHNEPEAAQVLQTIVDWLDRLA